MARSKITDLATTAIEAGQKPMSEGWPTAVSASRRIFVAWTMLYNGHATSRQEVYVVLWEGSYAPAQ